MKRMCTDWQHESCMNDYCSHRKLHDEDAGCDMKCDFVNNSNPCESISKIRKTKIKKITTSVNEL